MSHRLRRLCLLWAVFFLTAAWGQQLTVKDSSGISITSFSCQVDPQYSHLAYTSITIGSSGAAITGLSITATTESGGVWLYTSPASATSTPANINVFCFAASSLSNGTYKGNLKITSTTPASTFNLPVTFTVGSPQTSTITLDQTALTFSATTGGASPASQQVNVTSSPTGAAFSVTTSSAAWLQVSPSSGTAPAAVTVSANPSGLAAGSYVATITFTPASGSAVSIGVTLKVTAPSLLSASVSSIQFSYTPGGVTPAAQTFNVTTNGGGNPLTASVTGSMTDGTGWLTVTPATGTTPFQVSVSVSPSALTTGTYHGNINLASISAGASLDIPITLIVGNSTGLQPDVSSLSFSAVSGSSSPPAQQVNVTSIPTATAFSASAATVSGGSWLQVSPTSATAPAALTVSVNSQSLAVGTYTGSITLTPATGTPVAISVSLTVSASTTTTTLAASVTGVSFYYTLGAPLPLAQTFQVTGPGGQSAKVEYVTTDASGWFSVSPSTSTLPFSVTVTPSPKGYAAGTYTGKITLSIPGTSSKIDIPVTLIVSTGPLLIAGTPPVTFLYWSGGPAPASQTVALDSSAYALAYTTTVTTSSGGSWLSVSPATGVTPQKLTIAVDASSLAPGTYTGVINVTAGNASNTPLGIPVTLVVSSSFVVSSPPAMTFNYQVAGLTQVLTQPLIAVSSGDDILTGTASIVNANCASGWLSVSPTSFTTPANINVTFNPTGLSADQSCAAVVVLTANGVTAMTSVIANVSNAWAMNVTPLAVRLYAPAQSRATSQTLTVSTTNNVALPFLYSVTTTSGGPWLSVTRTDNIPQSTLTVTANPANLLAGTYTGTILFSGAGSPPLSIPVVFVVTPATLATITPVSLAFAQTMGGTPPPLQLIDLATTGGSFPYTVAVADGIATSSILSVTPRAGSSPAQVAVGVLPNTLGAGNYEGSVKISVPAAGSKVVTIPVRLAVRSLPANAQISATPASLTFSAQQGTIVTSSQTVTVNATGGPFNIEASIGDSGRWLSVTPSTGTAPGTFSVTIDPSGLPAARYTGTVTLTSLNVPGSPIAIPVQLEITPGAPTTPTISAISNAASGARKPIAPGEMVAITGALLGPFSGTSYRLNASGTAISTSLSGTQVFFDEFAAPLLYVSAAQVNAIVPYEIAGRKTVQVKVQVNDKTSAAFVMQTAASSPGIFTVTQNGAGQAAILNADNSVNSMTRPIARGSIVQVFGTGEGVVTGALTGYLTQGLRPITGVTATVGGLPAEVVFAGAAPGAVAGLFQVNVVIPLNALPGEDPIVIRIAGNDSQPGATVAVSGWF